MFIVIVGVNMKICVFNGMDDTNDIEDIVIDNLKHHELTQLKLRDMDIGYCRCCASCAKGECMLKDQGIEVVNSYKDSEVIIFLTPIKYGAYSKNLKKAVDRLLPIGSAFLQIKEGYMIHKMPYNNKIFLVIGIGDKHSQMEEEAFKALVKANYINFDAKSYKTLFIYSEDSSSSLNKIQELFKEGIVNG